MPVTRFIARLLEEKTGRDASQAYLIPGLRENEKFQLDQDSGFGVSGDSGRLAPVGDLNTYDITCRGKKISLAVNGGETLSWDDFPILRGHLGIQAEFANYEIRALRWKPLP
jgi:hypothetical protein